MIARLWSARTAAQNAETYESFLVDEVFPAIRRRSVAGLLELNLLRREVDGLQEFVTIFWFTTIEAVKNFAGDDYHKAIVDRTDRDLLVSFSDTVDHYDLRSRQQLA